MKFLIDKQDTYTLLALEEDKLDSALSPAFKSELVTLSAEGTKNLVLDLSKVARADASGISALIIANNLCKEAEGTLAICGLSEALQALIKLSQLENTLNIVPTRAEAIEFIAFGDIETELRRELGSEE